MAMTFTIVSHLREKLSEMVIARAEKRRQLEHEKERLILEVCPKFGSPCIKSR